MAYLSSALASVLHDLGWSQQDLAAKTKWPASQISRYVRGKFNSMPLESVQRLLRALPEEQHSRILVGYLRDCLPDGAADLVEIAPRTSRVHKDSHSPVLVPGIDRDLDRMLRIYADLAMRHPEVRDMLRTFLDAIGALRAEAI